MRHKVFLGIQTLGMIQKKSPAQRAGLDHSSRLSLTLAGCSSAEPASVSVQQCKIQISNLYLQPVKKIVHRHNELRKLIYTTNPIESYHRMIRKVTKTKGAFSSEDAILKQVYLAIQNAQTKWKGKIFNWNAIRNQLNIYFAGRLNQNDTVS